MRLILGTIDGQGLDHSADSRETVIPFFIDDIGSGDDLELLYDALGVSGMPALGDPLKNSAGGLIDDNQKLRRIIMDARGPKVVRGRLIYATEAIQYGGFSAWVIEDTSRIASERGNVVRVGILVGEQPTIILRPLQVGYVGDDPENEDIPLSISPKRVETDMPKPIRQVRVTAVKLGPPDDSYPLREIINCVNANEMLDLPRGYWLLSEANVRYSKYEGYHEVSATIESNVIHDWSKYEVLKDNRGRSIFKKEALAAILEMNYACGIINLAPADGGDFDGPGALDPTHNSVKSGILRFGPHPLALLETYLDFE